MKKILAISLATIVVAFFVIGFILTSRNPIAKSMVGPMQSFEYQIDPGQEETSDLTLIKTGGTLNLASSGSSTSSINIDTNIDDWVPVVISNPGQLKIEQPNRPERNWQGADYAINDWQIDAGYENLDLKIDARIWKGVINLSGLNLSSFQLADLKSSSIIRIDNPTSVFNTFTVDSVQSDMKIIGLLNAGAKNVIIKAPFGDYLIDFSGELQQDMSVVITTGFGATRLEIPKNVNAQITYLAQSRKTTIEGDWKFVEGTTYVNPNPGYLLDIVVNSDQGDRQVVLVE